MATALIIYNLGGLSDAIKYNAIPANIKVSQYGDISSKDDLGEFVVQPMLRGIIGKAYQNIASQQEKKYSPTEIVATAKDSFDPVFWDIWNEEMGFNIDKGRSIIAQLEAYGINNEEPIYYIKKSELLKIISVDNISIKIAESFFDRFTLLSREKWDEPLEGYAAKEIYPWRLGRRLSIISKPILQIDEKTDPTIIIAPNSIAQGFRYLVEFTYTGRLAQDFYKTKRMRNQWWGNVSEGHSFTKYVAQQLTANGWQVRIELELTEILNIKLDKNYGDIDILAWRMDSPKVWVIECKDLSPARNYPEIARLLSEYQGQNKENGKPDKLKRHLDRYQLLEGQKDKLAAFCKLKSIKTRSALICKGLVPMQFKKIEALDDSYVGDIKEFL